MTSEFVAPLVCRHHPQRSTHQVSYEESVPGVTKSLVYDLQQNEVVVGDASNSDMIIMGMDA